MSTKFYVGQKVYNTMINNIGVIQHIVDGHQYPIIVRYRNDSTEAFTKEGKRSVTDTKPAIVPCAGRFHKGQSVTFMHPVSKRRVEGIVTRIKDNEVYPITVQINSGTTFTFTSEGKLYVDAVLPMLFPCDYNSIDYTRVEEYVRENMIERFHNNITPCFKVVPPKPPKFKVGQIVFDVCYGVGTIKPGDPSVAADGYPIAVDFPNQGTHTYTENGYFRKDHIYPRLFPIEAIEDFVEFLNDWS